MSFIASLRNRQPGRPIHRILWWHLLHFFCFVWFLPCYRYRAWGVHNIPDEGPVLLVSNHQSFLDPIIVGLGAHKRQFYAMARASLWHNRTLAFLIDSLNALPVERGESDLKTMRTCIDVMKKGHAFLIFPEGSRTDDGATQKFETGMMLLIKRARPRVVPVALEGAFDVWPRRRKWPRLTGRIGCMYDRPIDAQTLIDMGPQQAIDHLRQRIEHLRRQVARKLA